MSDLLVPAPSIPLAPWRIFLSPTRYDTKTTRSRCRDSTDNLNTEDAKPSARCNEIEGYWSSWRDGSSSREPAEKPERAARRQILSLRMRNAESYQRWEAAAKELDHLEGNDKWKTDDTTPNDSYNPDLIAQRLRDLDAARQSCDIRLMMYLIRTSLSRDLGAMGSVDLYRHSYLGTKGLIERYVDSTLATIDTILTRSGFDTSMEHRDLLEGMLFARQSFGRSALLLSGGGTFGMAHVGVLKSLFESELLPRIISGASAGSIVAAVICTKTDEEIPAILREFPYGNLAVFEGEESKDGALSHLRRLLTEGSWSDIRHLTSVMREIAGDLTFQEAYNRTRRILNICVSTASVYELPRLLNYVSAPNVMIWSAVAASCSVPLVFNASPLLVKNPATGEHSPWNPTPQHWIDGSVDNDLPMTRLAEMFNVNHFIVSQVNPHVVPFLAKDDHLSPETERPKGSHEDLDWISTLTTLAKEEAMHRLQFLTEAGIFPNLATKFRSILSQRYSGDITIFPKMTMHDLPRLLANPTSDFMLRSCLAGEQATWPKLSRIRDRCAIELALDRAVHRLRARVVFSERDGNPQGQHSNIADLNIQGKSTGHHSASKPRSRQRRQSGGSLLSEPSHQPLLYQPTTAHRKAMLQEPHSNGLKRTSKSHIQIWDYDMRASASPAGGQMQAAYASPNTLRKAWLEPWSSAKQDLGVSVVSKHDDTSEIEPSDEPLSDRELDSCDEQSGTSLDAEATKISAANALECAEIDVSEGLST